MTNQAGGVGAAISMAYKHGRHDQGLDIAERLEEMEDQIAQNKIVLQYLVDANLPRIEWTGDEFPDPN